MNKHTLKLKKFVAPDNEYGDTAKTEVNLSKAEFIQFELKFSLNNNCDKQTN